MPWEEVKDDPKDSCLARSIFAYKNQRIILYLDIYCFFFPCIPIIRIRSKEFLISSFLNWRYLHRQENYGRLAEVLSMKLNLKDFVGLLKLVSFVAKGPALLALQLIILSCTTLNRSNESLLAGAVEPGCDYHRPTSRSSPGGASIFFFMHRPSYLNA